MTKRVSKEDLLVSIPIVQQILVRRKLLKPGTDKEIAYNDGISDAIYHLDKFCETLRRIESLDECLDNWTK